MIAAYLFLASLGVLFMADAATTVYLLSRPGSKEGNPIVAGLINRFGLRTALIVSKLALLAFLAYFVAEIPDVWRLVLVVLYVGVVSWNGYRIYKKKVGASWHSDHP